VKVLLDTNIVLDIALERLPFAEDSSRILEIAEEKKVHLYITASVATDIFYILRKQKGRETALDFLRDLLQLVDVCSVDKNVLLQALNNPRPDFEDAVQIHAALAEKIDTIITRDQEGYAKSSLTVKSPEDFLREIT
jgi:predicted nucleic acid-binding protein